MYYNIVATDEKQVMNDWQNCRRYKSLTYARRAARKSVVLFAKVYRVYIDKCGNIKKIKQF